MEVCPLTGQNINLEMDSRGSVISYKTRMTGKVQITSTAFSASSELSANEKYILIGICRNRAIRKEEPILITAALLSQLNNQEIPYAFQERARHFLKYLYDNGGNEYKEHDLSSAGDNAITYSSPDEFARIIKFLKEKEWIDYRSITRTNNGNLYNDLYITDNGIQEIEKGLPQMLMIGLVNQQISTGDQDIDNKINHARQLFFNDYSTLENKRSACETLSFVLEPLRKNIQKLFSGDTEYFFRIVNEFNIRHNNERTKSLEHEEQLEWIFYSLLNSINTYVKLKNKLGDI